MARITLLNLIDDVNKALKAEAYFAALSLVLTIPDICSLAEYGNCLMDQNGKKQNRYIVWFDEYIGQHEQNPSDKNSPSPMPYLSGEVVYQLRCKFLHEGHPNIDKNRISVESNKIDKFTLVIQKSNEFDIYADSASLENDNNRRTYDVNVQRLCMIICMTAKKYYETNKDKFSFEDFNVFDWDEATNYFRKDGDSE